MKQYYCRSCGVWFAERMLLDKGNGIGVCPICKCAEGLEQREGKL